MTREEFDAAVDRIAAEELLAAQTRMLERIAGLMAREAAEHADRQAVDAMLTGVGCTRH